MQEKEPLAPMGHTYPPVVSCTVLVVASILSVTKPWGRRGKV